MSETGIQAVVLAGGEGSRLRPFLKQIPKPLVPLEGIPILEVVLRQLARFGFRRIVITIGHQADLVRANFSNGAHLGLQLSYAEEKSPLGTAGPLAGIEELADDFLVLNGDLLTTLDFRSLFEEHRRGRAVLTIAAHERSIPVEFGIIEGKDGAVRGYVEKPELRYRVSMGIYGFNRSVLRHIEPAVKLDFPDLVLRLLGAGEQVRYFPFEGYWLDIGCGEDYERAREDFPAMRKDLLGE
jgi:NDP-sugar pyrophosphorylase family protein